MLTVDSLPPELKPAISERSLDARDDNEPFSDFFDGAFFGEGAGAVAAAIHVTFISIKFKALHTFGRRSV